MKHIAPNNDSSVHSTPHFFPASFAAKLTALRAMTRFRVVVLVILVAGMATVSFTTSSASSWAGFLRSHAPNPAATTKPSSARRIAPAFKKQAHPAAKQGKDVVGGTTELNIARKGHTATRLTDGKIIMVGGENSGGQIQDSEVYDPESRAFSLSAKLKVARAGHTATRLDDGRILITGGHNSDGALKSTELFDPGVNQFSRGPVLVRARSGHTATVLADGRILIAGGDSAGTAEIFDPNTMKFTRLSSRLAAPRTSHSAILLKSGRVLIAGGLSPEGEELRSGEVFDPVNLEFASARNSMFGARTRPTLHELPDGKVQVIGGDDERSMEMFNAEGQYFTARARLVYESDSESSIAEVLRSSGRAALIDNRASIPTERAPGLRALRSPVLDNLLVRGDALADLLDRSDHTITEIPETGTALITGGKSSRGMTLMSSTTTSSSGATVTTDKTDYAPGETVIISGTGWAPAETVELRLHRDEQDQANDTLLSAVAHANGEIQNSEYLVQQTDLGVSFLLTATGLSSGFVAQTTFTDGQPQAVVLDPISRTVTQGNSALYETSVNMVGNSDACTITLEVITGLPTGATAGFNDNPFTHDPGNVNFSRTLTISTTGSTPPGTYPFTVRATRGSNCQGGGLGPTTSGTLIVVAATVAPDITCPDPITVNSETGQCSSSVTFSTTATGQPTPTVECKIGAMVITSPHSFPVGSSSVTCTATNSAGSDSCSFTVTVKDIEAPTCNLPADINQNNDPGVCGAAVNYSASANDNCPGASILCTPASGSTFSVGTTTVQCTASDTSADSPDTNCSFTVTIKDTEAPTCNLPADITQNNDAGVCGAVVNYTASASDNCSGATILCNPASGSTFSVGTTTVQCTASDVSTDSPDTNCSFTVTIKDTEAPTCNLPADITQNNDAGACGAVVNYTASASDNCPGATILCTPASGSTFSVGTTTVQCTATDVSTDSPDTNCSFTVTIKDTEAPTCNLPANITQNNDAGVCGAVVSYSASASDNCPGATIVCTPASGSPFPVGTTTVACTASDASPDSADTNCSFSVTVKDIEAPTCNLPLNIVQNNDSGLCGAVVNYAATASDNCPGASITCTPASGSTFPVGTTTVYCVASDASADSPNTNCSFTVKVKDVEAPTCLVPAPIVTPCTTSSGSAVINYTATTTDNCGVASITCIPPSGSTFGPGTTTVTCTATDASTDSLDSTCSFTVTVAYNFNGFFQPVDNIPDVNLVKAGQSVPLKFQLTCGGNFISNLSVVTSIQSIQVFCDGGVDGEPIPADDSGASGLHYDFTANQFIYSWKTDKSWANKCRKFILTLNDGSVHCAYFKFKK